MHNYDYSKLIGKIKEKRFTHADFAKKIGMAPSSFSLKLKGEREFRQCEIEKSMQELELPLAEVTAYFFCH